MDGWIAAGIAKGKELQSVVIRDGEESRIIAQGYELKRTCEVQGSWEERVFVVHSPAHADKERQELEKRLSKAQAALWALTPAPGKGKHQIKEEEELKRAAEAIMARHAVSGLLSYSSERESRWEEKWAGRGQHREKQVIEHVRYQIIEVQREETAIEGRVAALGWRAYVTNAAATALSLEEAVLEYRQEYLVERGFERLKGKTLQIAPMFVKRDAQVIGLTRFLSLGVGVLALLESLVRRALQKAGTKVSGLYQDSVRKETEKPTSERLLRAFAKITLTQIFLPEKIISHVTPLNRVQQQIIALLGFSADLYASLARTLPRSQTRAVS